MLLKFWLRLVFITILVISVLAAPAPSQSDLKRMLREIANNENAYGVIQVVPYSERLPAYLVIANQW